MDQITTVKTPAAGKITELREARNAFAKAVARHDKSHSTEDQQAVDLARQWVEALEEKYKEGRAALVEHLCEKQPGYKKRSRRWIF